MENIVEVQQLNKQLLDFSLKNVSFNIKKGFITGFIGPNGAGKSTTIRCLMNLTQIDQGEIKIFNQTHGENTSEIKQRIGFVYDENYFYDGLTIEMNKRIIAPFYNKWNDKKFYQYLKMFQLPKTKRVKHLSKGMKMKFSLAMALSHDPELIIMDEPTSGLDPIVRRELLDLLQDIILDENKAVFFSTHNTTDIERIADYITFIHNGEIVYSGEKDEMFDRYALVKGTHEQKSIIPKLPIIGIRETEVNFECLVDKDKLFSEMKQSLVIENPTIEDIMFYTVRGESRETINA